MAQKYMLVPLPCGIFKEYDLVTRAVVGALYDRHKISEYSLMGGDERFYDYKEQRTFCVFSHDELVQQIGVSEKTIRRSLDRLKKDNMIWWYKAKYGGANRYFLNHGITDALRKQESGQNVPAIWSE